MCGCRDITSNATRPNYSLGLGTLTEGKGSVRLTSLCLLVWISSFYIENIIDRFYKTSYPNEEVNRTEPSLQLVVPAQVHKYIMGPML
jgi:hypothetical protein